MQSLDERMKEYEKRETGLRFFKELPTLVRIDGRNFSNFTKGLDEPYDANFRQLMGAITMHLVEETNALVGYTQSDEITLLLHTSGKTEPYFGAKKYKLQSILAAIASVEFNARLGYFLPKKEGARVVFDARAWQVPSKAEAVNVFLWRRQDCIRNAIQSAAQTLYSHNELLNKNSQEMMVLLEAKGVRFSEYPQFFRFGTFFKRHIGFRSFSTEELQRLPPKHDALRNPDMKYRRVVIGPWTHVEFYTEAFFNEDDNTKRREGEHQGDSRNKHPFSSKGLQTPETDGA